MASTRTSNPARPALSQLLALAVSAGFVLVGILGFVPGVTTHVGDLPFAGHHSDSELLGLFEVSVLHNAVHLLLGLVGLGMARKPSSARSYLVLGGAVYLLIWVYGLFLEQSVANVVPFNMADNWLHLGLGLGMVALGLTLSDPLSGPHAGHTR